MKRGSRAQMQISFGMIFSIILVIIFIVFAFYAIKVFLDLANTAKTGKFINSLETNIEQMWKGSQGSQKVEYILPTKITYVCFFDFNSRGVGANKNLLEDLKEVYHDDENMAFYPIGSAEGLDSKKIEHIDIDKITQDENPFCVKNSEGKIKMTIKKSYNETLVMIME